MDLVETEMIHRHGLGTHYLLGLHLQLTALWSRLHSMSQEGRVEYLLDLVDQLNADDGFVPQ